MNKTTFKAIMKPTRLGNNFLKHKYDVMKEFITPKKIFVFPREKKYKNKSFEGFDHKSVADNKCFWETMIDFL